MSDIASGGTLDFFDDIFELEGVNIWTVAGYQGLLSSHIMIRSWPAVLAGVSALISYNTSRAKSVRVDSSTPWQKTYGNGQFDSPFSGPLAFAHLPYEDCLTTHTAFDIAIVGFPFDTSVTYRPGARFGPQGIRVGSRRLRRLNGWDPSWNINPYDGTVTMVDCGDVSYGLSELIRLIMRGT